MRAGTVTTHTMAIMAGTIVTAGITVTTIEARIMVLGQIIAPGLMAIILGLTIGQIMGSNLLIKVSRLHLLSLRSKRKFQRNNFDSLSLGERRLGFEGEGVFESILAFPVSAFPAAAFMQIF